MGVSEILETLKMSLDTTSVPVDRVVSLQAITVVLTATLSAAFFVNAYTYYKSSQGRRHSPYTKLKNKNWYFFNVIFGIIALIWFVYCIYALFKELNKPIYITHKTNNL